MSAPGSLGVRYALRMRIGTTFAALALCAGCVPALPSSSAFVQGTAPAVPAAQVRVVGVGQPAGAQELGIVEANGGRPGVPLDAVVAELRSRAASIGADLVRLDGFATKYEMVTEQYTYDCGHTETVMETRTVTRTGFNGQLETAIETVPSTKWVSKTCTGTRQVEVARLTLTGRAFRSKGAQP